jgi:hypothetical protein
MSLSFYNQQQMISSYIRTIYRGVRMLTTGNKLSSLNMTNGLATKSLISTISVGAGLILLPNINRNSAEVKTHGIGIKYGSALGTPLVIGFSKNSPAREAGIRQGDVIGFVDDHMTLWPSRVQRFITGEEHSVANIVVFRDLSHFIQFNVSREVLIDSQSNNDIYDDNGNLTDWDTASRISSDRFCGRS